MQPLNMHGHANTWEEELQEVCAERDALRAENERLKASEIWVADAWVPKSREGELLTEIDRLKSQMAEYLEHYKTWDKSLAEIERLTRRLEWHEPLAREVERLENINQQKGKLIGELGLEIERLRAIQRDDSGDR